jgi:hypothetical protein
MNSNIATQWVSALRGGEYAQCKKFLRIFTHRDHAKKHDALGVLCCLYEDGTGQQALRQSHTDSPDAGVLPDGVMQWATMLTSHGQIVIRDGDGKRIVTSIVELNDGTGPLGKLDFSQLADVIEQYYISL